MNCDNCKYPKVCKATVYTSAIALVCGFTYYSVKYLKHKFYAKPDPKDENEEVNGDVSSEGPKVLREVNGVDDIISPKFPLRVVIDEKTNDTIELTF